MIHSQVPPADEDVLAAAVLDQQPLQSLPEAAREVLASLARTFPLTVGYQQYCCYVCWTDIATVPFGWKHRTALLPYCRDGLTDSCARI